MKSALPHLLLSKSETLLNKKSPFYLLSKALTRALQSNSSFALIDTTTLLIERVKMRSSNLSY
ncbi:hypothetical protein Hanom_Chr12g01093731 [Helianthus anomalus]|jgi:hypothetical protein